MLVAHVGIAVRDLSRVIPFYRDVLGGELLYQSELRQSGQLDTIFGVRGAKVMNAFVRFPGLTLEMIQIASPDIPDPDVRADYRCRGWKHLALAVQDIEATRKELEVRGVVFRFPIQSMASGSRMCYLDDPEGNIIEIIQRPAQKRPWD
jgi:catechol 2,3-dioxygenase-like lactoylglutathione lyase family enzyme